MEVAASAASSRAKSSATAPPSPPPVSAYRATRSPSYSSTTEVRSTSPANSSCGGPGGGPDWVPMVADTRTERPGRAQTASARRSSAVSSTRSPRAGQAEKSARDAVRQASGAARVNRCGSSARSAEGWRAYGGAAAPLGPQPRPGMPSSVPHTTSATTATSAARRC